MLSLIFRVGRLRVADVAAAFSTDDFTTMVGGLPLNVGHAVCLDTWVYGQGWLTCLDVSSGQIWQANQRGQRRGAHLDDFLAPEKRT